MKAATPSQRFNVRPFEKGSLFVSVYIFDTKREMYSFFRWFTRFEKRIGCNFEAIVLSRATIDCKRGSSRMLPKCATMLFVKTRMTMEIVTHESGHAALSIFRRRYKSANPNDSIEMEENLCYLLGEIGRQIVWKSKPL